MAVDRMLQFLITHVCSHGCLRVLTWQMSIYPQVTDLGEGQEEAFILRVIPFHFCTNTRTGTDARIVKEHTDLLYKYPIAVLTCFTLKCLFLVYIPKSCLIVQEPWFIFFLC